MRRIPLWLAALLLASPAALAQVSAEDLIRDFDADKNGGLDGAELDTARRSHAGKLGKASSADLVARFDTDGGGGLDAAEIDTLFAELRKRPAKTVKSPVGAGKGFAAAEFAASTGRDLAYWLYEPNVEDGQKVPLVVCLHGSQGHTDAAVALAGRGNQARYPCFILAPAIDSENARWAGGKGVVPGRPEVAAELEALISSLVASHAVDPSRIYITGQSMGGFGTFGMLARCPELFAAAVPVCGGGSAETAAEMAGVPVWAFHGTADDRVPVSSSREMIAAIKAAGGDARLTEYEGVGHNSWNKAYAEAQLWEWLFAQQRVEGE